MSNNQPIINGEALQAPTESIRNLGEVLCGINQGLDPDTVTEAQAALIRAGDILVAAAGQNNLSGVLELIMLAESKLSSGSEALALARDRIGNYLGAIGVESGSDAVQEAGKWSGLYRHVAHPNPYKTPAETTDDDRQRIRDLLRTEDLRRDRDVIGTLREKITRELPFRMALRQEGPTAVPLIIDYFSQYGKDTSAMHRCAEWMELCAGPENLQQIMDFMVDSAQYIESYSLTSVAARFADVSCIPRLFDYMGGNTIGYTGRVHDAAKIAVAAEMREKDPDARGRWTDTISHLSGMKRGARPIFEPQDIENYRKYMTRERMALRLAEKFYEQAAKAQGAGSSDRLDAIRGLYALADEQLNIGPGRRNSGRILQRLESKERPSRYGVGLGIEIEIERSSLTAPEYPEEMSVDELADIMIARLAMLDRASAAGVPSPLEEGPGILKEYAHLPAKHYITLSREVQLLAALGLVNPEYTEHPLHVTTSRVTSQGPKGKGVVLLTRALEATGWCSSAERIRRPIGEFGSWAFKGKSGIKERERQEIVGDAQCATETRTWTVRSLSGLNRTLRSWYGLGGALRAYQTEGKLDPVQKELSAVWQEFDTAAQAVFFEYGMDACYGDWRANEIKPRLYNIYPKTDMGADFMRLADLLEQAASDPNSDGAHFQEKMQQVVIDSAQSP